MTRWIAPAATFTLLALGVATVSIAITLAVSDDDAARPATSPTVPAPTAAPAAVGAITDLTDPTWVAQTALAAGIAPTDLASYAGASIAVARTHPTCGLGWNTLAAIAQAGPATDTTGPLHLPPAAWPSYARDGDADGQLIGASIVALGGEHLGHLVALGLERGISVADFADQPWYHPTVEEALQTAARALAGIPD